MDDLISRQAALNELPHAIWGKEWDEALAKAIIESLPSIEPKRGEWKPCEEKLAYGDNYDVWARGYKCSICGNQMGDKWKFCPNCGAKMEG